MPTGGRAADPSLSLKISLAAASGVGKTAITTRFDSDTFDASYTSTLGAKVSSRRCSIPDPRHAGRKLEVAAAIWDIMGNIGLRDVLRDAYFHGAQGVLLVCDGTRPDTTINLPSWGQAVASVAGEIPTVVLVNKSDLAKQSKLMSDRIQALCGPKGWTWMMTSARTGENVPAAFELLARLHIERMRQDRPPDASPD